VTSGNEQTSSNDQNKRCYFCDKKGSHWTSECSWIKTKSAEELFKIATAKRLCKLCLRPNHTVKDCRTKLTCSKCSKRHNTALHFDGPLPNIRAAILKIQGCKKPLMHVVKAYIVNERNDRKLINVFLDSGSEVCILTSEVANELKLNGSENDFTFNTVGGQEYKEKGGKIVSFHLTDLANKWKSPEISAHTMSFITKDETLLPFAKSDFPHLKSLDISMDLPRKEPVEIHLLLGEPYYSLFVTGPIVRGKNDDQPIAWGSKLGYFLGGQISL